MQDTWVFIQWAQKYWLLKIGDRKTDSFEMYFGSMEPKYIAAKDRIPLRAYG